MESIFLFPSVDEMEARAEKAELYLSTDNLERLDKDNLKKSGLLSDEKLRNIITYLDEVETAERLSQIDQVLFLCAELEHILRTNLGTGSKNSIIWWAKTIKVCAGSPVLFESLNRVSTMV